MKLATLEMGPTWKMHILCGLLEERGIPAFVQDSNIKLIDPFITGAMSFDARLQVPEESVAAARAALEEVRTQDLEGGPAPQAEESLDAVPEAARDRELEAMAALGQRIRWAAVLPWMHPFAFLHGFKYLHWTARRRRAPDGHAVTILVLVVTSLFWLVLLAQLVKAIVEERQGVP